MLGEYPKLSGLPLPKILENIFHRNRNFFCFKNESINLYIYLFLKNEEIIFVLLTNLNTVLTVSIKSTR